MSKVLKPEHHELMFDGTVIPAIPLALKSDRSFDERRQRALARYYAASGAGGLAVGVHTTQFEIRDPEVNLFESVLRITAETIDAERLTKPFIKVAGICGPTEQAVREAKLAVSLGYDVGLLSNGGLGSWSDDQLVERTKAVADIIPVIGFYLQPSVGGRLLSFDFWRRVADVQGVVAVKIAPFNRYQTLDVVRAVCMSERRDEIALYTGNDDNIVIDLLTKYSVQVDGQLVEKRIVGGLLGHWAVWTNKAVELLEKLKAVRNSTEGIPHEILTLAAQVTDCNAAFFDPSHSFAGCIPGIHEVLRRQGLLEGRWCLNPKEELSPGQMEEIDRVYHEYPDLNDDAFIAEHLDKWLQ
jgi:hypothetical protein